MGEIFSALRLLLVLAVVISASGPVAAQNSVENTTNIKRLRAGTELAVKNTFANGFLPHIRTNKPEYEERLKSIKVVVVDDARPTASAAIEGGKRVVRISIGVTFVTFLHIQYAAIRNYYKREHNAQCPRYLEHLAAVYSEPASLKAFDFTSDRIYPWHYCGLPQLITDSEFHRVTSIMTEETRTFEAVFGVMLGHEIGHHVLGHLPPKDLSPAAARRIEFEADHFASNILGNYAPRVSATLVFDFLSKYRRSDPFATSRRHPPAECRYLYFMSEDGRFWGGIQGPDLATFLEQRIDIKERIPQLASFIQLHRQDKEKYSSLCDVAIGPPTPESNSASSNGRELRPPRNEKRLALISGRRKATFEDCAAEFSGLQIELGVNRRRSQDNPLVVCDDGTAALRQKASEMSGILKACGKVAPFLQGNAFSIGQCARGSQ